MPTTMPDIANFATANTEGTLDWVGMSHIELPINVTFDDSRSRTVHANVEAFVNLKEPMAKGIHMSRLYLLLDKLSVEQQLSYSSISELLDNFITSHQDLSDAAYVKFQFDSHLRRKSLLSENEGWKAYPTTLTAMIKGGERTLELSVSIPYSSTCPCSAALARQLIQNQFEATFLESEQLNFDAVHQWLGSTKGIVATPHSQRSVAELKLKLSSKATTFPIIALIDHIEETLQTPVQTAVKRIDEQEFARLNGQNLMFCEDAARKLKYALNQFPEAADFWVRINHYESLHPHDAVSVVTKGIEGGYTAY